MSTPIPDRAENDDGFTLVELMVVVLIIAILIAIAIPTFLGARDRAQNSAAQSSGRLALVVAKVVFTDGGTYGTAANDVGLAAVEPSLAYKPSGTQSTGPKEVSVSSLPATDTTWSAAILSASGRCYLINDDTTSGTAFGTTTDANCTGTYAATPGNTPLSGW